MPRFHSRDLDIHTTVQLISPPPQMYVKDRCTLIQTTFIIEILANVFVFPQLLTQLLEFSDNNEKEHTTKHFSEIQSLLPVHETSLLNFL